MTAAAVSGRSRKASKGVWSSSDDNENEEELDGSGEVSSLRITSGDSRPWQSRKVSWIGKERCVSASVARILVRLQKSSPRRRRQPSRAARVSSGPIALDDDGDSSDAKVDTSAGDSEFEPS